MNIFALLLLIGVVNAQDIDRSIRPSAGPAKEIDIKDAKTFTLPNGLKVFVVEDHRAPIIYYSLNLDIKPALEKDKAGMSGSFDDVFGTATNTRTKEQINKDADLIGSRFNVSSRGGSIRFLKQYQSKALELLSDVVLNPVFNESELKLVVDKYKSGLAAMKDDASSINTRVSQILTYGKNYPDGEVETNETLDNITVTDLQNFYTTYFAPNVTRLVIVGDITEAEAKANAEKYFGKWKRKNVPVSTYIVPQLPKQTTVAMVERPGAPQSTIDISYPVEYKTGAPDETAASVMNYLLGGGMSSRLPQNLREKHSYTYGVYSNLDKDEIIGRFNLTSGRGAASVKAMTTDSAIYQTLYEMKELINNPVPGQELENAKAFLAGSFGRSLDNPSTIAQFAINIDKYNLPKDYYKNYLKRLDAITVADVQVAAKKYLKPDNAFIVVVGDKSYADGLKTFAADETVHFYDTDGNLLAAPSVQTSDITAEDLINKYVEAIGGKVAIENIKDYKLMAEVNAMGQKLEMTQLFKQPNLSLTTIGMGGMIIQKILFNGTALKMSGMQGNQEFTEGDEFESVRLEASVCPEMNYIKNGYELSVNGIEKVNGADAYVLNIKKGDKMTVSYYDKNTGLKVKTSTTMKTPAGEMQQISELENYQPVEGVKFPFTLKQTTAGITTNVTVKSVDVNKGIDDTEFQ